MAAPCWSRVLGVAATAISVGCGGSPSAPSSPPSTPAIAIVGLAATVEPLTTTPEPGLAYRLTYQVRESRGLVGATLMTQHFVFSNGATADGTFAAALVPPHVMPAGTITLQSTYSVYPASVPAVHVEFTVGYTDDRGAIGTATAGADISRVGF